MKRNVLNAYGKGLQNLSEAKIKDFKVKIKVSKIMKWFKDEVELIQEGQKAISEKYELENQFNDKGEWKGNPEELEEFKNDSKASQKETVELLDTACENVTELKLTEDDLMKIDITPNDISDLMMLNLLAEE